MHGKEDKMNILEDLREKAGFPGPVAQLANEMLVIRQNYEQGQLNAEEYQYLLEEVANIRAQQELANDEVAMRWVVAAAQILAAV